MEIITLSNSSKSKLGQKVYMCLTILYELEDIFDYKQHAISDCINFLQDLTISSPSDIAKEILNEKENN